MTAATPIAAASPHVMNTYGRLPLALSHGRGCRVWDVNGKEYLDGLGGIAVNTLGHGHPQLVAALQDQVSKLIHSSNYYHVTLQETLAAKLVELSGMTNVFFCSTGLEANEAALKLARKFGHDKGIDRPEVVVFEGAFHGRSTGAIAAAGSEKMVKGFGPLMPGFRQLKWGDHDALRAAITTRTCAVIIEPVQGEGGIRVVPDQCLKGLRDLCDETGTLLIFDEVQCGVGRTGKLFAHEWAGVTPDIMMVAKGIGGGFPLGAVLATENAASGMGAGTHGSTYGGNPLGCAVGAAVMGIVAQDSFLDAVSRKGAQFRQGLEGLVALHPTVFEAVRGQGLMLGLKCKVSNLDVVKAAYAEHLLTVPAADNVLRLLPALNIPDPDIAEALARLDRAATRIRSA